jgi:plasmid maintenance system antidote protein VapI
MPEQHPAEVFPPAEYIKDEMEFRGMSREQFMKRIRPGWKEDVAAVLEGKPMSAEAAVALSEVFGTSVTLWRRLDAAWWAGLKRALDDPACPRCAEPGFNGVLCDKCGCKNPNPEESDGRRSDA